MFLIQLIYFILILITNIEPYCQKPGETKFFLSPESGSFYEAIKGCKDKLAMLVSVDSMTKLDQIKAQLIDGGVADGWYWSSGNSYNEWTSPYWSSFTTGIDVPKGVWCPDQPNNKQTTSVNFGPYNEACMQLYFEKGKNLMCAHDTDCFAGAKYICEITLT